MKPIIKVENLSKKYLLGINRTPYSTFRETLMSAVKFPLKAFRKNNSSNGDNVLWALKDVGFEVMPGEVVGIIGRNGAGKSTLLKILSRITEPTTGKIELFGRVGSLLEVGTGFHPELTGRENIFLNGAILGMRREEIAKKFDEIVDFAEVEKFIDTAVKFYSSGMYVRLAFAVAAHLEPEILVIDEVLAVGDMEFQKKCLGKMQDISVKDGRTVLFVSHQLGMIKNLCTKGVLLKEGELFKTGSITDVLNNYQMVGKSSNYFINKNQKSPISQITTGDSKNLVRSEFSTNEKIQIKVVINEEIYRYPYFIGIAVKDELNNKIFTVTNEITARINKEIICEIPEEILVPGVYQIDVAAFKSKAEINEYLESVCTFYINDGGTNLAQFEGVNYGRVFVKADWYV